MSNDAEGTVENAVPVEPRHVSFATCQAWARAIIAFRGQPPYQLTLNDFPEWATDTHIAAAEAELAVINDFCEHWKNRL